MQTTTLKGNLIELARKGHFDVIAHGCNCYHLMGAGIAAAIKTAFPEAWLADRATKRGCPSKLGSLSAATLETPAGTQLVVANLYTQFRWGPPNRDETQEDRYKWIAEALGRLKELAAGRKTGLPKLGAGLARGQWERISAIIADVFPEAVIVELQENPRLQKRRDPQELQPA